jgi:hypothetical protein
VDRKIRKKKPRKERREKYPLERVLVESQAIKEQWR